MTAPSQPSLLSRLLLLLIRLYQLTLSRDGEAVLATRSVRLRPGTIEPALYADWIRVLAAIDQREEQRLEILGKAPAPK